ncbi:MAG: GNAT family N-acetyltransferase, partial [Bryobacteraceae bacterium]
MRVVEIRTETELRALRDAWTKLLPATASHTIFQTWEWVKAWWSAYGKAGELCVLMVFDTDGTLRGIIPLRSGTASRYGRTVPVLDLLTDGSNDADYLDFIVADGYETAVMDAVRELLAERLRRGTVLRLNEIAEHSRTIPLVRSLATSERLIWQEADVPCTTVSLPDTWEEYLSTLRPRFRGKIRSTLRNLEARPEVSFGICQTSEDLARLLPALFELHTRRWELDGKPGVFGWAQKRDFYRKLSPLLLQRGWLRFTWLAWNGHILACQYGFASANTYFQLQEGYEPASEHWNVGIGLRAWSIREFIANGMREYDFLGGMARSKVDWGAHQKLSKQLLLARPGIANRVFCCGPEWERQAREFVSGIVPQRVLAARQSFLARGSRNGQTDSPLAASWVRKAAARCYVNSPLPAMMRPLRDRYRVSGRNKLQGISWQKRAEPSARIFFYHRVNDNRDPFFPACSTDVFERQIRFLAKHYQVVKMAEMLDRLEQGDPSGHMVAITFDDGYEDSYQQAYPILRRYNLPATIFLTTAPIDHRQPLWFESLAAALKSTSHDHLDVEIDIPRRFWLRTEKERLDANARIFSLLRSLSDEQRRLRYEELLRMIGASGDADRKDKMLSWDQVREMQQ